MTRPRNRRSLLLGGAGLMLGGGGLLAGAGWRLNQDNARAEPGDLMPSPTPSPTPPPWKLTDVDPANLVTIENLQWHAWALLDHEDGALLSSAKATEASRTCSVIKVWIAADYLRRAAEKGATPSNSKLAALSKMIRDSDNNVATQVFSELGKSASFKRMQQLCGLTDFTPNNSWGQCKMSARDMVRLAAATAAGTAAGPQWTPWLLDEMRNVRRGLFGVRKAMPPEQAAQVPIKNGWDITSATKTWNLNNLVANTKWSMVVMVRYPSSHPQGLAYGEQCCDTIAGQLLRSEELEPLFSK